MMARKPFVQVIGPSGGDLVARLGKRLVSVSISDVAGSESDALTFVVAVDPPFPSTPPKGTRYAAYLGWSARSPRLMGIYTVQSSDIGGDAEAGYTMTVTSRASDFVDTMKRVDSEHFEQETAGGIFQKLAGRNGMVAVVDQEIASLPIAYRLRWNQSVVDFASDLADEVGGTMKLAGGKMVVQPRGDGKSGGGLTLPTLIVPFSSVYSFSVQVEVRGEFKETGGAWFDPAKGQKKIEKSGGPGQASEYLPAHPFADQEMAKRGGKAAGREVARKSATGSFDMAGELAATGESPVKLLNFGSELDGLKLVASGIEHKVTFDEGGGWVTTVQVEGKGDAAG